MAEQPEKIAGIDSSSSNPKPAIFPILLVNFIGTLSYSIILPFLVVLVHNLGGNGVIYGLLGAIYSFFQLIGAAVLGDWSDKVGRKKILLLSQAGTFVAWLIFMIALLLPKTSLMEVDSTILGVFALTIPLLLLFGARILDGLTGGNVSVAKAYLSDVSPETERKNNFSKMAQSGSLGYVLGPALAGVLGGTALGEILPVTLAVVISLAAIFIIAFMLWESVPGVISTPLDNRRIKKDFTQEHKEAYRLKGEKHLGLKQALKLQHVPFVLLLYFLKAMAFTLYYVAFPIHAVQGLHWSLFELGIFFSVLASMVILVEGLIMSKISHKYSDSILILSGSVFLAAGFYLYMSNHLGLIFLGMSMYAIGNGLMWPSFLSLFSKVAGNTYQGAIQGYGDSAASLASIVGFFIGGVLYGIIGVETFLIPGTLLLIIFVFSFRLLSIEKFQ